MNLGYECQLQKLSVEFAHKLAAKIENECAGRSDAEAITRVALAKNEATKSRMLLERCEELWFRKQMAQ